MNTDKLAAIFGAVAVSALVPAGLAVASTPPPPSDPEQRFQEWLWENWEHPIFLGDPCTVIDDVATCEIGSSFYGITTFTASAPYDEWTVVTPDAPAPPPLTYWVGPTPEQVDAFVDRVRTEVPAYITEAGLNEEIIGTEQLTDYLMEDAADICRGAEFGIEIQGELKPGEHFLAHTWSMSDLDSPYGKFATLIVTTFCPEVPTFALVGGVLFDDSPTYGSGVYTVSAEDGEDNIPPGTYESFNVEDCYWARLDINGEIIDNYFGSAPRVQVTIQASDYGFHSEGCGGWTVVEAP